MGNGTTGNEKEKEEEEYSGGEETGESGKSARNIGGASPSSKYRPAVRWWVEGWRRRKVPTRAEVRSEYSLS